MKLILCAGTRHIDGFKNHDVKPYDGTDYVCDFFDIVNHVGLESCEEIHFTHALEHFPQKDTQKVLGLIFGLLKQNGRLYLEVPNFMWHAGLLLEGKHRDAVYYAFGGQLDEWDFHKTGFTKEILEEELVKVGFREISVTDSSSLQSWATK